MKIVRGAMPDQTAPEYVPRPSNSTTGIVIAVVKVLLGVVCGVGLLGVGLISFRALAGACAAGCRPAAANHGDAATIHSRRQPPPVDVPPP